jgi:hypothetical protein
VAKERVICPFSKDLCKECALYRGRHYYLCYSPSYRGYLGGNKRKKTGRVGASESIFSLPDIKVKTRDLFQVLTEEQKEQ